MTSNNRYQQAKKVTLIGAGCNALLGIAKIMGGYLFHSHALVADGIHSFSDLVTDIMVLFASKYGSHDADESHPYGHQRIETAATLFLSLLLCLAGFGIAWDACEELIYQTTTVPNWPSLLIITASIVINEALFHYTQYIGKKINSSLIIANAWHHRSDAASSIVVLIGIIGSLAGLSFLDAAAAVVVGFMIIKMGWDYGWNSVKELVDTAIDAELLSEIESLIDSVHGVKKIHQLRSRSMGNDVFIDVHIIVSPRISVSEGHYIAQKVHHALVNKINKVKDVTVHVDHEDDEMSAPSLHLPSRIELERQLAPIQIHFPEVLFWDLHYVNGALTIDVFCNESFLQWQELKQLLTRIMKEEVYIKNFRLFNLKENLYRS